MNKRKKAASTTTHSLNKHDKGNEFQAQYQIVYQSFKEYPKTMLDVSLETGILRLTFAVTWLIWKIKG